MTTVVELLVVLVVVIIIQINSQADRSILHVYTRVPHAHEKRDLVDVCLGGMHVTMTTYPCSVCPQRVRSGRCLSQWSACIHDYIPMFRVPTKSVIWSMSVSVECMYP